MKIYSFPPIAHAECKTLILGTMPGNPSLLVNEYYGNPRNHFWKILFTLHQIPYSNDYEIKKNLLLQNKIALWDVLQTCERQGSLDSAIAAAVPNDFDTFLNNHAQLTHIYFNGQKAAQFFKQYVKPEKVYAYRVLPSTSPAHAGMTFEQKLEAWKPIRTDGTEK